MARMTVKTLAAVLGVSPATVSNAYNRPDQLSPQLRERILATAEELGYPGPDAAGRTLRMGRADAVGVLSHRAALVRVLRSFRDRVPDRSQRGCRGTRDQHRADALVQASAPARHRPRRTRVT